MSYALLGKMINMTTTKAIVLTLLLSGSQIPNRWIKIIYLYSYLLFYHI